MKDTYQVDIFRIECGSFEKSASRISLFTRQIVQIEEGNQGKNPKFLRLWAKNLLPETEVLLNCCQRKKNNKDCSCCFRLSNFWRKFAVFFLEETERDKKP